ncbi:Calcineurin-like phosphoesterase [Anaerohalosphaera lusitana]|uniref:Calcineurin-like phosphoesterase n=1 Tax=Anaerohalosphaera lusitana TaxID=1936003 RepID=A0A1U9NK76_9BACT|nr:metallophosphoesterase family protein [Anaerohalosphaera lusitana]AQT67990.1 Calcineurin-like phosphoesterase [Anaerohalosphaera lusitana]
MKMAITRNFRTTLTAMLILASAITLTSTTTAAPAANAIEREKIFTKVPYLQSPGPDRMTICWETDRNTPGTLFLGKNGKYERSIGPITPERIDVFLGSDRYLYTARLTDLTPGTQYQYRVQIGTSPSPLYTFKTFDPANPSVSFIMYGDSRTGHENHTRLASRFLAHDPAFILHSGDLVSSDSFRNWGKQYFNPMAPVIPRVPVLPSIGNHEGSASNYLKYFHLPQPERYYHIESGPVFVLTLDADKTSKHDDQYAYASRALANSDAPWKIVLLHEPMFNVGGHRHTWDGKEAYLPLFRKHKVDIVVAGHSHIYERFHPLVSRDDPSSWAIQHITSGGGGAPLHDPAENHPMLAKTAKEYHFITAAATPNTLTARTINIDGQTIDTFTLRKQNGQQNIPLAKTRYEEETG